MSRPPIIVTIDDTPQRLIDACLKLNVNYAKVHYRMRKLGLSFENAIEALRLQEEDRMRAEESKIRRKSKKEMLAKPPAPK